MINPYKARSILRTAYIRLNEFLCYSALGITREPKIALKHAIHDAEIDIPKGDGIAFCDFYDSFFEIVDNNTSGKIVEDYVTLIKSIRALLEDDVILNVIQPEAP